MSKILRRVPLDFAHPIGAPWPGSVNPYYRYCHACRACERSGYNPATRQLWLDFYDLARTGRCWHTAITQDEVEALQANGRLRAWHNGKWAPIPDLTAEDVNRTNEFWCTATSLLAAPGMHHDGISQSILTQVRAKRLGIWGYCSACDGSGEVWDPASAQASAAEWESTVPPEGDGYQLWDDDDARPLSPVFGTIEGLASWCAGHAPTFGSFMADTKRWVHMLETDFVCHQDANGNLYRG